jgi:folate-dependent tRNA-U54 methylase TrmFO/GidA
LFLAGQITGVEGYLGTSPRACLRSERVRALSEALLSYRGTMLGSLCHYICNAEPKRFQPMKANFGLLPEPATGESASGERDSSYTRAVRKNPPATAVARTGLMRIARCLPPPPSSLPPSLRGYAIGLLVGFSSAGAHR